MGRTSTVYLLHLEPAYRHARHYLGSTARELVADRIAEHVAGRGSPLVRAAVEAGSTVELVRTWTGGRQLERRLKDRHESPRLCPRCRARAGAVV
jgi:hypothetical protein